MAEGRQETRTHQPLARPLMVLRIVGLGALLGFPVAVALVSRFPYPTSAWLVLSCPVLVLLAFIFLGAGFRVGGGVYRGALAGAALYVLIGAAFDATVPFSPGFRLTLFTALYWGWLWPLVPYALVLRLFGIG